MQVRSLLAVWIAGACLIVAVPWSSFAAPSADRLLPASTKAFLSMPDVARLSADFNRSQFGQLVGDPAMKPFLDGLKQQLRLQGLKQLDQLGLSWAELEGLPTGEAALAVIEISPDEAAVALVTDVTGHSDQAAAVLAKVGERLTRSGAKRLPRAGGDPTIVYQFVGEPARSRRLSDIVCTTRCWLPATTFRCWSQCSSGSAAIAKTRWRTSRRITRS